MLGRRRIYVEAKTKTKVRPRTIVLASIGVAVLALLFYAYWTDWRFEKIRISGYTEDYIDDYREYIYKTETVWFNNLWFENSWLGTKLYILPSKKELLLEKIKEDVINALEYLIGEYSDIYYKYEVSDDFRRINVYQASRDIDENKRNNALANSNFSVYLISLYHSIRKGHSASRPTDYTVKFIEPPKPSRFDPDP